MTSPLTPTPAVAVAATIAEDATLSLPADVLRVEWHSIGSVDFPSGRIVSCDPLMLGDTIPFDHIVPPSTYELRLLIVYYDNDDQRVGAAAIVLNQGCLPSLWELAVVGGYDVSNLQDGEIVGFAVDSGTAGFADSDSIAELENCMDDDHDYYQRIVDDLGKTYVDTWSWVIHRISGGELQLAVYSAGLGDGVYPSYWGFDSDDRTVCLIQDFGLLDDE